MPILLTALVVGILDGLYPMVVYFDVLGWNAPRRVMQSVAAGVLGRTDAVNGGTPTALLGVALHFTIALIWSAIYGLFIRRLHFVQRLTATLKGRLLIGTLYGAFIWLWMNYVVIALSRTTVTPMSKPAFWSQLIWHMVGVGPTIVLLIERHKAMAPTVALAPSIAPSHI